MNVDEHGTPSHQPRHVGAGRFLRATGIIVLLAAVVALGNVITRVSTSDRQGALAKSNAKPVNGSDAEHKRLAENEAERLLALLRLPPESTEVPCTSEGPTWRPESDNLVLRGRCWKIPMPFEDVADWIRRHPPRGLTEGMSGRSGVHGATVSVSIGYAEPPGTDAYREPMLQVTLSPDIREASLVRASGSAIWVSFTPNRIQKPGRQIRVTVDGGCPSSLGKAEDVRNEGDELKDSLLPIEDPVGGFICTYSGSEHLVRRVDLTLARSRALARAIDRIFLGSSGTTIMHCPNDIGLVDVLVFKYAHRADVDLWYHNSGCTSLDNGHVASIEVGNPDSDDNFLAQMSSLGLGWNHD